MISQVYHMYRRTLSSSSIFRYRYYSDTEKNYDFRRLTLENSTIKKFLRKEVNVEEEIRLQKLKAKNDRKNKSKTFNKND